MYQICHFLFENKNKKLLKASQHINANTLSGVGVCGKVTCVMDLAIVARILKLRRALAATTAAVRFKELLAKVV